MATKMTTRTRIRIGAAAFVASGALVLSGCSSSIDGEAVGSASGGGDSGNTTTSSSRTSVAPTTSVEPEEVDVFDLTVGDCLVEDLGFGEESVTVEGGQKTVPCSEPHTFEVYHEHVMTGRSYPGEDAAIDEAAEECSIAFDSFVGMDYQDSVLDLFYLYPTEESWAEGDRVVSCLIGDPDGETSGTLRGANR
ncbi:MAG: hypothetical protein GX542_02010 [Rhodococcus sp.]|nr:hypothetical protein [Rhodococcus sp. (in: high G+C Gram-positive bacteria)]